MDSNALVRLTNTTAYGYVFEVDVAKPVKFVSRLTVPPNGSLEVEVEYITAMSFFSYDFQNAVTRGDIILTFAYTTLRGTPSTAGNFVANITRFFNANRLGWQTS